PSKPASYWKPKDIGKINAAITAYRQSTTQENDKDTAFLNTLETILRPQREVMEKKQKALVELIATKKAISHDIVKQNKWLFTLIGQRERKSCTTCAQLNENITELTQLQTDYQFLTGAKKTVEKEINKLEYDHKFIDRALQRDIDALKYLIL